MNLHLSFSRTKNAAKNSYTGNSGLSRYFVHISRSSVSLTITANLLHAFLTAKQYLNIVQCNIAIAVLHVVCSKLHPVIPSCYIPLRSIAVNCVLKRYCCCGTLPLVTSLAHKAATAAAAAAGVATTTTTTTTTTTILYQYVLFTRTWIKSLRQTCWVTVLTDRRERCCRVTRESSGFVAIQTTTGLRWCRRWRRRRSTGAERCRALAACRVTA